MNWIESFGSKVQVNLLNFVPLIFVIPGLIISPLLLSDILNANDGLGLMIVPISVFFIGLMFNVITALSSFL